MLLSILLLVVLGSIVVVAIVARRFAIPYPIAFVIAGSLLAFFPHLPSFTIDPNLVFLIFLPPLLFSGGWGTDWTSFKSALRPILQLAIGLVVVTTGAVAVLAHALLPSIGWAAAFVLGAVVSPPDAVAAGAVFERFSVPRRIATILDGEGLVNDASALVIYNFAVAAVITGQFSPSHAGLALVFVVAGGIALGLGFGYGIAAGMRLLRRYELSDYLIDNAIQIVAPYAIYLTCQTLEVSGVLGVVTAGIYLSRSSGLLEPDGRLVAFAFWDIFVFLLNGVVFLLIGLQMRAIVHDPSFASREIWIGLLVSALVIVVRIAWAYPASYLPHLLSAHIREHEQRPGPNYVFVVAWSGMRGIVSLAGALALPLTTAAGASFPGRNDIVFITFCVIFVTLVFQGLTLIPLLKILRIDAGESVQQREMEVRIAALRAGIARLRELEPGFDSTEQWEVEGRIVGEYEYRIAHLQGHLDGTLEPGTIAVDHDLEAAALSAERDEIGRLRGVGEIPDEIYRRIQYDLDLADERLT